MLVTGDPQLPLGARGERPLRLKMDQETGKRVAPLIPGATWTRGHLTFAWEALPAAQRVFNLDPGQFELAEPAVDLPGLAEYRELFAPKLRPYQFEMVQFLALRAYAINADPMRCLDGDTLLTVRLARHMIRVMTLRELVQRFKSLCRRYTPALLSMCPNGRTQWNRVTAVHAPGRKKCKRITLSTGEMLVATSEHKVVTVRETAFVTADTSVYTAWADVMTQMRPIGALNIGNILLTTHQNWGCYTGWVEAKRIICIEDAEECEVFDLTMANPLNNYVANGIVVSNSGKTPTTLAAASLIGSKKTLIVCPAIAKLVWATELVKWMQQPSLILGGRAGDDAREFCVPCNGTGRDADGRHCAACKRKNGQSYGTTQHDTREAVTEALDRHRFVIANFDILAPQVQLSDAGVRSTREDLPGWHQLLTKRGFDLLIIDEAHVLRGRSKKDRAGESRRDKLVQIAKSIKRLWALTGTPIYGRVADLWAMLDVVTDGLFGRPWWNFDVHYCSAHKGEWGWVNDGMSNEEELKSRLDYFLLKRDRKDILPGLPPKTRQIIRIDARKADFKLPKSGGPGGIHGALRVTANIKEPFVVEAVGNECAEGAKCVVFTYLRDNCEALAEALAKSVEKDPRLKLRNMRVWAVTGDTSVEARFKQAQAFREWTGSAVFVATIDSVPVAISLKGAQSVHFADLTFEPASLLQAEDRPYEVGTNGLAIVYYVVDKTIDEHVIGLVLPKMEMLEAVMKESAATDFGAAFGSKLSPEAMAEEIWARMEQAAL